MVYSGMNRSFLLLAFSLIFWGCKTSFKVSSDFPQSGNFDQYSSFKFFNPKNLPPANFSFSESHQKVIFNAVGDEMSMRGYRSIQEADLIVKVQGGTKSTEEVKNDQNTFYDPYYRGYGYPYFRDQYPNRYQDISRKETTIIIDMIDTKNDRLVWQGVGTGILGKKAEEVEGSIRQAIHQIFQQYPYTASE